MKMNISKTHKTIYAVLNIILLLSLSYIVRYLTSWKIIFLDNIRVGEKFSAVCGNQMLIIVFIRDTA
jgi:MFS-type transporter involved in bile tolerance (Atg22 family)